MNKLFAPSIIITLLNLAPCSTPINANEENFLPSMRDLLKNLRLPLKEINDFSNKVEDVHLAPINDFSTEFDNLNLPPIQSNMPYGNSPNLSSSVSDSFTPNSQFSSLQPSSSWQARLSPTPLKSALDSARNKTTPNGNNGLRTTHSISSMRGSTVPYPSRRQRGSSLSNPICLRETPLNLPFSSKVNERSEKNNVSQEKRPKAKSPHIPQEDSYSPPLKNDLNSTRNKTTFNENNGLQITRSLSSVRESTVPYPSKRQSGSSLSDPICLEGDHPNLPSSSKVYEKSEKNNVSQEKRPKATSSNVKYKFVNNFDSQKNKLLQPRKDGPKWTNYDISDIIKKKNGDKMGSN